LNQEVYSFHINDLLPTDMDTNADKIIEAVVSTKDGDKNTSQMKK
jgi:hypothetical protein